MDSNRKFLALLAALFTTILIISIYFIALSISDQSYRQYQAQINKSDTNFNRSVLIHNSLFDNITDLKKGLDPIIAIIPNATEQKERNDIHFNQTAVEYKVLQNVTNNQQNLTNGQQYITNIVEKILNMIGQNKTIVIVDKNSTNGTIQPLPPLPVPAPLPLPNS